MRSTAARILVWTAAFTAVAFLVVILNQTLQLALLAERIHPVAGEGVFWGLMFVYAAMVSVPFILFVRLPSPLIPPQDENSPEYERHLVRLGQRLAANRLVDVSELGGREEIEAALGVLDAEAETVIRAAGNRAFVATAVSQNGALDALLVLGIQSRLIWDVARIYSQRPALRDMAYLYGNVMTTAFIAEELDEAEISEQLQPVIGAVIGSSLGAVPGLGPAVTVATTAVLTGSANAFLTLRVGIITQEYSRALTRQERRGLRRAAATRAIVLLGGIAGSSGKKVAKAVIGATGQKAKGLASSVGDAITATATGAGKGVTAAAVGTGKALKGAAGAVADRIPFRGDDEDAEEPERRE